MPMLHHEVKNWLREIGFMEVDDPAVFDESGRKKTLVAFCSSFTCAGKNPHVKKLLSHNLKFCSECGQRLFHKHIYLKGE